MHEVCFLIKKMRKMIEKHRPSSHSFSGVPSKCRHCYAARNDDLWSNKEASRVFFYSKNLGGLDLNDHDSALVVLFRSTRMIPSSFVLSF